MEEWLEQLLADLSKGEKTDVLFKKYKQLNGDVGMLNKIKAVGMLRQRPGYDTDKAISSVLGEDFKKKYLAQVKPAAPTATATAVAEPPKKLTQEDFGGDPFLNAIGAKKTTPAGTTAAVVTPDKKVAASFTPVTSYSGAMQPENKNPHEPERPYSTDFLTEPEFNAKAEASNAPHKEFTGRTVAKTIWTNNGYVTVPYDYQQPIDRFEPLPQMTQFKSGDIRENKGASTGYEVFRYDREKGAWGWTAIIKPAKISGFNDEVTVKAIRPKVSKEDAELVMKEKTKTDKPFKDYLELSESDILKRKLAGNPTLADALSQEINKNPTKAKTGDGRLEVYQNAVAKNYKMDVDPFKAYPLVDPPEFTKYIKQTKNFEKLKELSTQAKNLAAKYQISKNPKTLDEYNAIVDKMKEYKPLLDFFARKDVSDMLHLMALQSDGEKEMASALNYFPGYREKIIERENKRLEQEGAASGAGKSFAKGTLDMLAGIGYTIAKVAPYTGIGAYALSQQVGTDELADKYYDNYKQWSDATFQTGIAKNDFFSFVNSALQTAPQVIGIMLTRNPVLGQALFMAAPAYADSYHESMTQGLSEGAAHLKGIVDAGIEVATEQIVNDHALAKGFRPSAALSDLGKKGFHTPEFRKLFTKELGTYIATRPYRFAKEYTGQLTEEVSAMILGRMSNAVANALSGSKFQTEAVGDEEKNLAGSMALITLGMKTIGRNWQGGKAQGYRSIILKNAVNDFDGAMAIVESLKADPDVHPKLIQQIENDLTKLATLKFNKNSSPEQQVVLVDELKKLKELQDEKENTEKALHEPIDEKIKEQQLKITNILGSPKLAQAMFDKQIQSALDDLSKHGDKQGGAYVEAALKLTGKTMDDWWKEKVNAVNYRDDLTPEEKEKEKDRIMEEHGKWLVARHTEEGKEVFTDFDDTVSKNGKLTPLGEELKKRAASGEKVTVLTAREDTPANRKYIADQLGIPEDQVKLGLDAKGKAAHLTEGSVYYNENRKELDAGREVKGVTVVDTNINTPFTKPTDVATNADAIQSVVDGKRNVAFVAQSTKADSDKWEKQGLTVVRVGNADTDTGNYVVFKEKTKEAQRLIEIANKYDGALPSAPDKISKDEVTEIGNILNYSNEDVRKFLEKNKFIEPPTEEKKPVVTTTETKPAPVEEKPPVEQEEKEKPDPDRPGVASEKFTGKNITTINAIAATHPDWKVRKLYKAAAGAIRTWSKLMPKMSVTLHHSREEFAKEVLSDPNGTKEDAYGARGFYVSSKGIHINVPAVLKRNVADEVFHEAAHPVLDMIVKNNPAAVDKHFNELLGLEDVLPGVGRAIDFGVEGDVYKGAEKKKEAIIQFMTMVADREISLEALSPSALDRVTDFIKRFLNSIGFNYDLKVGINQADSLVDVARKFSYAINKGKALRFNAKPIKSNGETVAVNITLPKQWSKGEAITNTKEGVKQIDPKTLAGQDVTVIPSDRLHADVAVNEESGKKHDAAGGVFYPHKTGLAWATGKVTGVNNIVKNLRFDKDGFANIGIMIMGKDSHMSNVNSFEYALDSIEGAVRSGKVTIAEVIDKTNKALNTKGVADQLGEPFEVSGGISKVIRTLGKNFMVNEANFQARKAFLESVLGKTIVEGKTSLWGGVPTFNEVSNRLEEPAVKNVPSNHLVAIIKVSNDVSLKDVPEEDDRFHRSYPAPMGAKQVEFYLFNNSVPLPVFAPEMKLSGAGGEGKVLKWENYKETYKKEGEAYALEKYGRQVRLHPKTVTVPAKMQFSKGEINYDKWKGKNKEVSGRAIADVKTGEPIVAKVYHGTTHEFYEFDSTKKGNVEGHLGKINYFTSDYQDASMNYQAGGADITARIDQTQDRIEQELEEYKGAVSGLDMKRVKKDYNIKASDLKALYPSGVPKNISASELSRHIAEKQIKGGDEKVLEVYVKLNNPVVLGDKATWAEVIPEADYSDSIDEAAQEVADEHGIDVEEAKSDYDYEIRDRAIEMSGAESKVHSALEDAMKENGYDSSKAMEVLGDHMFETEVDLNKLEKNIRKGNLFENRQGEMASSQVIADFFKNLGHDGIILTDVSERFKGMHLGEGTSHVHVFDEHANQIKLSDGSNVDFGATNDIRFSKGEYNKRLDKAVSRLITEGTLPIELRDEYTALRKLEMTRGKLNEEYRKNVGKFIDTMKQQYGERPDRIIDLLHKVMPKAPTVKTEAENLFDVNRSSAEIISGVGKMVNDPYLNKSIETLMPYLKANPEIRFNKLFSIGKGESHYTGDWTVLLSEIENKKDLAHVAVHELYHAISVNGILANKEFAGRIDAIIDEARKKMGLEKYFEKAENTDFSYTKDVKLYGLLNNREFVAELFSNEDFAKLLDKYKVQGDRSFLDKVIDAIRKLVGLPERAYSEKIKESILKDLPHKIDLMRDPLTLQVVQNYRWAAKEGDFKYAGRDAEAIQYSKGEPQVYISKSDVKKASDWGKEINVLKNENTILEGQLINKKDLPKEIYHVTTKAPLISASGMIKHIPAESKVAGLGKGTSKQHWGVSLTTNRETAALIERDLSRMVELANVGDGDATQIFRRIANEDSQLTGVDLKDVADETIKLIEWRKSHGQGKNAAFNEFKYQYLTARQRAGGGENPIFFGDAEAFKQINPDDIGIIKVKSSDIPSEALIRKHPLGSNHLDEVMVHSDIPVVQAEQMQYSKGVDETKKVLDKLDAKQLQKLIDIKEQDEELPYQDSPGKTPDVNYHIKDLQDSVEGKYGVNEKSIAKDYGAPKDALIYTGEIPFDEMPSPVLAEREDGDEATYDWSEMQGRPKNMPPAKVRIEKDGTIKILDGNHRIEFWSEQGYDNVPAWIIDERKTDSKGVAEAYHAAKELDEDEREESHDELIKAVEDVIYPMQFSKGTSKKRDPLLQSHLDNIRSLVKNDLKGKNATNTQKVKAVKEVISDKIKQMVNDGIERKVFKGDVKASLLASVIKRLNATESPYSMLQFVDYLGKMMDNVEYEGDLQQANKIRKQIKNAIKSKVRNADKVTKDMVEAFVRVKPDNVSDIHDYIAIANRVLTAATGIKVRSNATGVSVKNPFLEISHKELTDYTQDQQELADEQAAQRIADMHQELVDNDVIDAKAMTAKEMIEIIKSISGVDEKAIADAKQQIAEDRDNKMGALKAVADYQRHALMEIVQDNTVALTPKEKETVRRLLKIDLETLTGIQLAKYIDVVNNILVNNNFVGAGDIAIQSKMREDAALLREKLNDMGVEIKKIANWNWVVKHLSSQALFFGFLTKLDEAAAEVQRLIGIHGVQSGNARARDIQLKAVAGYDKLKKGMSKDINSALNRYRRGVYADVMNNFGGTAAEQKVEFERRVNWIRESARLLRESSEDREQREAILLDHIIDELLEGSETQDDVKTKMQVIEPDNIRLVKYWQDTYKNRWDAVKENAEIFNNRSTEDVDNYTATMLKGVDNKGEQTDREIDINAQTFISQNLKLNPAGTKITKVRSKNPPPDRVLNLDFDYVQSKKFFETNYDVETAEHILQAKAFLESDEAVDLLGGTGNVKLVARNLQKTIALQRGQRLYSDSDDITKGIKFFTDWIHRKSTRLALLSLVQWGKQYLSILPNTIINLGVQNLDLLAKAYTVNVNDELYNLYNISQRGATRAGFTKMVTPAEIEEAFLDNNFFTALRAVNKQSEALTEGLAKSLVKGDVRIARRSWMAFYMLSLRKQGIETWNRDMDQEHLHPNEQAAAYAEQMVSKNQNPNDPSSMANLHRQSNDQWWDMIKNVALPFSTFPMNMRMRMTNDLQKLRYGTPKGRLEAGRSLIATAVEQFIFNYFKVYWIGQASTWAAAQLANGMGLHGGAGGGDDEAKKDKEEEEKLKKRWLANSISDLFFSGMGTGIQTGFQEGANMLHQLTTPPKMEYSVEKNGLVKVYADDWYYMPNKKLLDYLGIYGIAPKKIAETWADGKMAFTGKTDKILERSYGDHPQTEEIELTKKEQWVMIYLFCQDALGLAGLSDAEIKVMNSRLRKTAKDQLKERAGKVIENTDLYIPPKKGAIGTEGQ